MQLPPSFDQLSHGARNLLFAVLPAADGTRGDSEQDGSVGLFKTQDFEVPVKLCACHVLSHIGRAVLIQEGPSFIIVRFYM